MSDGSSAREARVAAHVSQLGVAASVESGAEFDVNRYAGYPFSEVDLLLSVGLSTFVFPPVQGTEATSFEIGFTVPNNLATSSYTGVVLETGEQILECFKHRDVKELRVDGAVMVVRVDLVVVELRARLHKACVDVVEVTRVRVVWVTRDAL